MLKKVFYKIMSSIMALLLLLSTVSFTVEKHFCGNHLVDTAIFSKAKTCGMEMPEGTAMKKGCCKNEVEVIKGQDDLKLNTFDSIDINQQFVLIAFMSSYESLFEVLPKTCIPHKDYSPPNLIADLQLLDQVFII